MSKTIDMPVTQRKVQTPRLFSNVEKKAIAASVYEPLYPPTEKIASIVVNSFPMLGRLTALRFLEWVQHHPGGVVSLPTGKTPEYFIKWVTRLLKTWQKPATQKMLVEWGIDPALRPDMKSLHFVQIDEFYPINSVQTNSFCYYVKTFYLKGFGFDPQKSLLIDPCRIGLSADQDLESVWPDKQVNLSLRYRHPKTHLEEKQKSVLERIDQWCMHYEDQIAGLGGIGFFLGGIGPDGHIGFNISGSDHHSTTRLCPINYETQAAAAGDLGGIEIARQCHVITIGLKTITRNPDCTAIIMAAGEAKADVVSRAIQSEKDVRYPATALQVLAGARFFLTEGAAKGLEQRQYQALRKRPKLSFAQVEKTLIDLSVQRRIMLTRLSAADFEQDRFSQEVLRKEKQSPRQLTRQVCESLERKIQKGIEVLENTCFLHTEPHHDDIMLGYFGHLVRHFRKGSNRHHFMTLTSGFTSVTNRFMEWQVTNLQRFYATAAFGALTREGYFAPDNPMARNRDVWQYLDGVAACNPEMKDEGCARRFLRNLYSAYTLKKADRADTILKELLEYFRTQYPGKQDPPIIQQLKGMCREWEVECLWGYYGWKCDNVTHLRLGFYTGDVFTPQPTQKRDILPIVQQMERINPDVVTVALDPEASGPDTHYKVLQAISEAMQVYQQKTKRTDIRVWGYRNVWYRFDPSEANVFVPVSLNMFSVMHQSFENAFLSQKEASFPSYEHDGPFSELAQRIQVQQYQVLKTCLGREWFYNHRSPLIRATRGFVFLKEMELDEFYQSCRTLRKSVEELG
jgi:glucosamine-6-phosphate deaminase